MNTSFALRAVLISGALLVGCSSSSATPSPSADASTADVAEQTDAGGDAAQADSAPPVDAGPTLPNADAGPITAPSEQWTWVPFGDSKCRDGSPTGIGINANPNSKKVMIFLEGGGACFNAVTCGGGNPSSFDGNTFDGWKASRGSAGVFNRADAANAVKDWSFVYVPYCTGDVHSGNNPAGTPVGMPSPQAFVGYANVGLFLQRIVPSFPGADQVLLTGQSAGGFGAAANYDQVAKAFGSVPVDMIDDAGPIMGKPYLEPCLQTMFLSLWSLDKTLIAACGADCPTTDDYMINYSKHIAKTYPARHFGLVDSVADETMSQFYGFGASNCGSFAPLSADTFKAGLLDARTQLASYTNFGSFLFAGTDHTSFGSAVYDTRMSGTTKLTDWVTQFVAGTVTNVGPP